MATLLTKDASVKTASVTIQSLSIGSKQVTLSVFRQVELEDLIDPGTLQLKGIPWGRVNYYWKDNDVGLHILWQKSTELRRDLLVLRPENETQWERRKTIDELADAAAIYSAWRDIEGETPWNWQEAGYRIRAEIHFGIRTRRFSLESNTWQGNLARNYFDGNVWVKNQKIASLEKIGSQGIEEARLKMISLEEELTTLDERVRTDQKKWDQHMVALNDLPQLFIAV